MLATLACSACLLSLKLLFEALGARHAVQLSAHQARGSALRRGGSVGLLAWHG